MAFADVLRALRTMSDEGVIGNYAVAGAMAIVFWTDPVPTFDLDVLVELPTSEGAIVTLDSVYRWAHKRGYPSVDEHIVIEGLPTQLLPAPTALAEDAIAHAATLDYEGVPVPVVRPEYLIALYLEPHARTAKRRERAAMLMELSGLDRALLDEILRRHGLTF
jgi:hypothetical protein